MTKIQIGGLYTITQSGLEVIDSRKFMVHVEGTGWRLYHCGTPVVLLGLIYDTENQPYHVRLLLPDGYIGEYWSPERLHPINAKE